MAIQIQLRRDTAANWTSNNPTLAAGEAGFETDTNKLKIGDGTTAWNSLAYTITGSTGAADLNELTDVALTTPTNGQVLKYNGTSWVNAADNDTAEVNDLSSSVTWVTVPDAYISSSSVTQHQGNITLTESQISDLGAYLTTVALNDVSDVTITTPSTDQVLKYNGTVWVNASSPAGATDLDGLTDVVITTPATSQVLEYNGTNWVNNNLTITESQIADLQSYLTTIDLNGVSDVTITTPGDGDVLSYDLANTTWKNGALTVTESQITDLQSYLTAETDPVFTASAASGIVAGNITNWDTAHGWGDHSTQGYLTTVALNDVSDVTITTPTAGQMLEYNGTVWVNTDQGSLTALNALSDVTITTPANGDVLTYNTTSSTWENTVYTSYGDSDVTTHLASGNVTALDIEATTFNSTTTLNDTAAVSAIAGLEAPGMYYAGSTSSYGQVKTIGYETLHSTASAPNAWDWGGSGVQVYQGMTSDNGDFFPLSSYTAKVNGPSGADGPLVEANGSLSISVHHKNQFGTTDTEVVSYSSSAATFSVPITFASGTSGGGGVTAGTVYWDTTDKELKVYEPAAGWKALVAESGSTILTSLSTTSFGSTTANISSLRLTNPGTAPTSTGDTAGANGEIRYDGSYIYIYVNGTGWVRSALSTF